MFYLFHHMPKCGGTSFNVFLESVFKVRRDYIGRGGPKANPKRMEDFLSKVPSLETIKPHVCLAGHYNLPGTFLWERYPNLENFEHRKFTVLRDPFETARSGVYFGMKRGKIAEDLSPRTVSKRILKRANYFARVLGVSNESEIDKVLDRYWFVAPLTRVEDAAKLIEQTIGKKGPEIGRTNTTSKPQEIDVELAREFRDASALDYAIYERASKRFDELMIKNVPA